MTNELKDEMNAYSDERIMNNIKEQEFYGAETVALAKEIALERGLLTEDQIQNIDQFVLDQKAKSKSKPFTPRDTGTTIAFGTVLFIIYIIVKYVIRMSQ